MQDDLFEKWYSLSFPNSSLERNEDGSYFRRKTNFSLESFKAGQQSKQAEIDGLQKRIDDLITSIDWHIEDCELWLSMNKNDSWKGGQLEILKAIKKRFSK